jgi:ribokinase
MGRHLRIPLGKPYTLLVGVGGVGSGIFFEVDGDHTIGRNESRLGRLLDVRDYCKLHIITHYVALMLGSGTPGSRFRVVPIGKVGNDANGHRLVEEMVAAGLDTRFVEIVPDRPTLLSVCFQYPDASGGNITTSESAASLLSAVDIQRVEPVLRAAGDRSIVLAVPEVPLEARCRLLELGTQHGAFRAASFTSTEMIEVLDSDLLEQVDLLAINEDEGSALTGGDFDPVAPERFLDQLAALFRKQNHGMLAVLSAGKAGAYAFDGTWTFVPAFEVDVASTAGAGDALFGGTISGIVAGMELRLAVEFGVLLASYSVTSPHTIHPEASLETLLLLAREKRNSLTDELLERIESECLE